MTLPDLDGIEVSTSEQQYDHARDAEYTLIGSCLRGGRDTFEKARDIITPDAFYVHPFGWTWSAMETLYSNGMGIDVFTVYDELTRMGRTPEYRVGQWSGRALLNSLRGEGDPRNVMDYAENVQDLAIKRKLAPFFAQMVYQSQNGRRAADILKDVETELSRVIVPGTSDKHTQTMGQVAEDAYQRIQKAAAGEILCVPTGYIDLDDMLGGGMYEPDLLLLAARPGKGKSALLQSIAKNAAEKGRRVAMFTLEMSNEQVFQRLIAQESGIPTNRQRSGKLQEQEWPVYTNATEIISSLPIIVNDLPAISPGKIRQILRKIGEVDLAIVDYIQLAKADEKTDKRYIEVGSVSQGLKAIAKEFRKPVLAAAQMSRASEQRADQRPLLSDLRESGSLEQDSDVVMFIHDPQDETKQNIKEVIIAKQRNGPVGTIELVYRASLTRFENAYKAKY